MDPHHSSVLLKVTVPQAFGIIVCQPVMVLFVAEYIFAPFYWLLHLFLQYVLSITFSFLCSHYLSISSYPKTWTKGWMH